MDLRTMKRNRLTQSDTEIDINRNEDIWVRKLENTLRLCRSRRTARDLYERILSFRDKKSPISSQNEVIIEKLNLCSPSVSDDSEKSYYEKYSRNYSVNSSGSEANDNSYYFEVNIGYTEESKHIYAIIINENETEYFDNPTKDKAIWGQLQSASPKSSGLNSKSEHCRDNVSTENLMPSQRYQRLKSCRWKDIASSEHWEKHPNQLNRIRKLSANESLSQSDEQSAGICGCFNWCSSKNKRKMK